MTYYKGKIKHSSTQDEITQKRKKNIQTQTQG